MATLLMVREKGRSTGTRREMIEAQAWVIALETIKIDLMILNIFQDLQMQWMWGMREREKKGETERGREIRGDNRLFGLSTGEDGVALTEMGKTESEQV